MAYSLKSKVKTIIMKKLVSFLFSLTIFSFTLSAMAQKDNKDSLGIGQDLTSTPFEFRKIDNKAFQVGEFLKFKFAYGIMNAGEATLEVKKARKKIQNRDILHVVGLSLIHI